MIIGQPGPKFQSTEQVVVSSHLAVPRITLILPLPRIHVTGLLYLLRWQHRQEEVRCTARVMKDMMQCRLTAADVIRDILRVRSSADSCWNVHACDLHADPVPFPKKISGSHDLNGVLVDLARNHGPLSIARKWMPRPPRQRTVSI